MAKHRRSRRAEESQYAHLYSLFVHDEAYPYTCFYCGMGNNIERDHQPAISRVTGYRSLNLVNEHYVIVYSCKECNKELANQLFESLLQRKEAIKEYLSDKRNKKLSIQHWNIEEIAELEPRMRQYVVDELVHRKLYQYRIDYDKGILSYLKSLDKLA